MSNKNKNKNKRKILYFLHDYEISGANRSLLDYIKDVNQETYEIQVIIPSKKAEMHEALSQMGIKCFIAHYRILFKRMYKTSIKWKVKCFYYHLYNGIVGIPYLFWLEKYIQKNKFDYIITNSFSCLYGAILARKTQTPHCFYIREFMELDHQITHYQRYNVKKLTSYSKGICISKSICSYYKSKYPFQDLKVIYNKIQLQEFKKQEEFCSGNTVHVLIAGALQEKKGQMDAIKAIEYVSEIYPKPIKLYICGSGPDETRLKDYCIKHHLENIIFLGELDYNSLLKIRKTIDISLICSEHEALGRVTVESMYYKSLTIGAKGGETTNLIGQTRGYLYTYGDYMELADKIIYGLENVELSKHIIEEARDFAVKNFSNPIYQSIFEYLES